MRHWFGGNATAVADVDDVDGNDDLAQLTGEATVTYWNSQAGGSQYTDLVDAAGVATDHSTTSSGSDGWGRGVILPIQGPDDVWEMWASVNGADRFHMGATDVGTVLGPQVTAVLAALSAHLAATGAANPHVTRIRDLADVNSAAAAAAIDGQV